VALMCSGDPELVRRATSSQRVEAVSPFRSNMDCHDAASETMIVDVAPAALFHDLLQHRSIAKGFERLGQILIGFQPLAEHDAE
jgi:hypothetical protein